MTKEQIEKRLQLLRGAEQQMQFNLVAVRGQIAEREWELSEMQKAEVKEAADRAIAEAKAAEAVVEEGPGAGDPPEPDRPSAETDQATV